jgi:hypothetical protein
MDREGFSIKDLTIEELTSQAMQLLNVNLADLYAVLGFQLMGYSRPARLAAIISYHTSLQEILDGQSPYNSLASELPLTDLRNGLDAVYEELKHEGAQFVAAVREDLCKLLCTPETLDLADRATASSVRVMLLMIAGALRMPPQTESLAATLGAIICKSGLKDFCQVQLIKN